MQSFGALYAPTEPAHAILARQERRSLPRPGPALLAGRKSHEAGPILRQRRDRRRASRASGDHARPMQAEAGVESQRETEVKEGSSLLTCLHFPKPQKLFI